MQRERLIKALRDSIPQGPHSNPHQESVSLRLDFVHAAIIELTNTDAIDALKKCASVLAGHDMTKGALEEALVAAKHALESREPVRPTIFVFGSNLAGRHGSGAAKTAREEYGAEYGVGDGPTGYAYAIPTKDARLQVLPLYRIRNSARVFLHYAQTHPELDFHVTRVGCGLAGYKDEAIAPFFAEAPDNCILPTEWLPYRKEPE